MTGASIITKRERITYRKAISDIDEFVDSVSDDIAGRVPLPFEVKVALTRMSNTTDIHGQHAMLQKLQEDLNAQYDDHLKYAAQFRLSPFCEYICREEVPAPHHEFMIERLEAISNGDLLRLLISMPPGHAKNLSIKTMTYLENGGTKTIGDLVVGDRILGPNGAVTVTAKSEVFTDKRCFTSKTQDGASVVSGEGHLWTVRKCRKRKVYATDTTLALFDRQSKMTEDRPPKLPDYAAVEYPEKDLPIDPYVLGLWLGDGTSASGGFTSLPADADVYREHVAAAGYELSAGIVYREDSNAKRYTMYGLHTHLRENNLLGNKHVPEAYLYGSVDQRMELLRGLMDTDGTIGKGDGQCLFCNTNRQIVDSVAQIVRSLGTKASIIEGRAMLYGVDHGSYWRVGFYLKNVVKLPRKLALNVDTNTRNDLRTISFEEVSIVPTQCITVDSDDGLFFVDGYIVTHNSTYSSHRFPAWYLGRNPNHKWLQAAHTMDFARNRLGKPVRGIISSERYRALFPEVFLSQDSSAADFFEFAHFSGYYKAVGVGTGVAGWRADIQAVDDPFKSREDAESKVIRDKVFDWYSADFTTRMARKTMPQFIVATRWHPDDLCGRIEELTRNKRGMPFEIINLPAVALDNDPMGRPRGEALWPSQFDLEILMELKSKLPGRDWNSLYMGDPVDEEGGVLNRANVHRYKNVPKDEVRGDTILKRVVRRIVLSVDCAEKKTQRSDFTAVTVWLETVDKKHYLVHAAHARLEFPEMVRFIDHIAETWEVSAILCEDHGAGTQYIQIREKVHGPAPVVAIKTLQKSKEFRFDGVSPMFEAKEVLLPEKGTDWVADVEAELYAFPHGRNDDYVDSTSQYLSWARDQGVRRGVKKMKTGFA